MKSKKTKNYVTGSGVGYQKSDYTAGLSNTANSQLAQKSGHTGLLDILGVNTLVFGVKDRDNQYALIEGKKATDINDIVERSTVAQYLLLCAAVVAVVLIVYIVKKSNKS